MTVTKSQDHGAGMLRRPERTLKGKCLHDRSTFDTGANQIISKSVTVLAAVLLTTVLAGTNARAEDEYGPLKMTKTAAGDVLTTPDGMTLYTFDKDKKGVSNCKGDCAKLWTQLKAE